MQITIELSEAEYHAVRLTHLDVAQWAERLAQNEAQRMIDERYEHQLMMRQLDPAYPVMPDREAAILAMPIRFPNEEVTDAVSDDL